MQISENTNASQARNLVLQPEQAETIYNAMRVLESGGGTFYQFSFDDGITFSPYFPSGYGVTVQLRTVEKYASRDDFAAAYGLN